MNGLDFTKVQPAPENLSPDEIKKAVLDSATEAEKELSEFLTRHEFPMAGECNDRDGNPTKVLVLDTDPDGILVMDLLEKNPCKFDTVKGEIVFNEDLMAKYLGLMLNIDMSDPENRKTVGWKARGKARAKAEAFFTLAAASLLPDQLGMEA